MYRYGVAPYRFCICGKCEAVPPRHWTDLSHVYQYGVGPMASDWGTKASGEPSGDAATTQRKSPAPSRRTARLSLPAMRRPPPHRRQKKDSGGSVTCSANEPSQWPGDQIGQQEGPTKRHEAFQEQVFERRAQRLADGEFTDLVAGNGRDLTRCRNGVARQAPPGPVRVFARETDQAFHSPSGFARFLSGYGFENTRVIRPTVPRIFGV